MTEQTPPTDPDKVAPEAPPEHMSGGEIYNTVTDKVGGPSIRAFDNLFSFGGAVLGGIVGLIAAFIISSSMGVGFLISLVVCLVLA